MVAGLVVHFHLPWMGPDARDITGDAMWAMMIAWWIGALAPTTRLALRGAAAYAVCAAVEFSQRMHTPTLDAVRDTTLGHLILGSGFDARDLASYAVGVGLAVMIESTVIRERERTA